ncbi:hypothetical protein, partial [Actinomadura roseirufa]|uniref:hypothetical protein n=1 Tax=Actinomadura roseirufa TaxID=2094049 RepID=UPI0013F17389
ENPAYRQTAAQLAPRPSAPPGRAGGLLPSGEVVYADRDHRARNLVDLRPVVFGIVPAGYRCGPVVAELANLAGRAEIDFLLVADPRPAGGRPPVPVKDLRACAGTAHEGTATIVEDHAGVLARSYAPVPISAPPPGGAPSGSTPPGSAPSQSTPSGGTPSAGARSGSGGRPSGTGGPAPGVRSEAPTGLTAVFVRPDGVVNEVLQSAVPGPDLGSRVMSLRTG